jgi:hypothetical protein
VGAPAGAFVALRTGGRQMLHGPYFALASFNDIGIWLRLSERQPARWYFSLVRVT